MFVTDAQLLKRIEAMLKVGEGATAFNAPFWSGLATDSNAAAFNAIRRIMAGRGYIASQLALWDDGAEFEMDIGLFWAFTKGAGLHDYTDKWIKPLDRRKELLDVVFTIGGVFQSPLGPPLAFGFGEFEDYPHGPYERGQGGRWDHAGGSGFADG